MKLEGQCFCGEVKYEIETPLKFIVHDHCSICRRISGAPFVTWAGVLENQFKLLSGKTKISKLKTTPEAEREFCSNCGSHLFFRSSRWNGEVHFTVATLISKIELLPTCHVFYSDKASWMVINDSLPKLGGANGTELLSSSTND